MPKGFGKKQNKPIIVESASVPFPSGSITAYQNRRTGKRFLDAQEVLERYGVSHLIPSINQLKVYTVKPSGSHPEIQCRSAYEANALTAIALAAATHGTEKGKANASKDLEGMVDSGMKKMGVAGAIFDGKRIIPVNAEGDRLEKLAIEVAEDDPSPIAWSILEQDPEIQRLHTATGTDFFFRLVKVALDRVYSLRSREEIAQYLLLLLSGIHDRNPGIGDKFRAAFLILICRDRTSEILALMKECAFWSEEIGALILEDVFLSAGEHPKAEIINGKKIHWISPESLRKVDQFWQGERRLLDLAIALEQQRKDK